MSTITVKPAIVPKPAPYNPGPTVASLQNELSQITLLAVAVSKTLGNPGPLRDLPAYAVKIMTELKALRAKK